MENESKKQSQEYAISFQTTETRTYDDGFADGYSRAWQHCWNFMLEKIQLERKEQEEAAKKRAEAEPAS